MLRFPIYMPRLTVLGVLFGAAAMQACTSATIDAVGSSYDPGFSLTVGAATLSLAPGGSRSIPIRDVRLTPAGVAFCWGLGPSGQLGNGSGTSSAAPVMVTGGLTFRSLVAGGLTVCGLTSTGKAYCWGNGDGTDDHRSTPVAVAGGLTFQSISSGTGYSCGVTTANAVYCWGSNDNGQLGDGTTGAHGTPVPVRWP